MTLLIAIGGLSAQDYLVQQSARSAGMAGAYTAVGDDVNAISANSAGLIRLGRTQLVGSYTRYYTGANIPSMNEGSIFFSPYTWGKLFYGVGMSYFNHEIFGQQKATIVVGNELWRLKRKTAEAEEARLSLAVNANMYRVAYNQNNFSPDFNPDDPVFANGYSKFSFSADANLLAEYGPLSVGLGGYNLLEPDISLRGGAEGGVYPRTIRGGVSYNIMDYITPAVDFELPLTSGKTISDDFTYSVGAESWFVKNMIGARAGVSSDFFTTGFSLRTRGNWDIGIDYAIQFPLGTPTEIGQTHKVSFNIGMATPYRVITDFIVEEDGIEVSPELASVGEQSSIYAIISNIGKMDAENIPVTLYYIKNGEAVFIGNTMIEKLPSGGNSQVQIDFTPLGIGYYDLFVAANDHGGKIPAIQREVLETDYDNNTGSTRLACFNAPQTGIVKTSRDELIISTVSKIREEIPMIPAVFFPLNSSEVSINRFGPMLDIVAGRLSGNPDVTIELSGFYDLATESDLGDKIALDRSNAVKRELVSRGVNPGQVEVIEGGYDMSAERVRGITAKDLELIQEENRVVMLSTKTEVPTHIGTYYYEDFDTKPTREDRQDFQEKVQDVLPTLRDNPDVFIFFQGFSAKSEKMNTRDAYVRAAYFRDIAYEYVPDWVYKRMHIVSSEGDEEYPRVETYISSDAVIFRPHGTSLSGESLEFSELGVTEVTVDTIFSETEIDSYMIIIREDGTEEPFKFISAGKGRPPKEVEWNWFGSRGQAPDPGKTYFAEVYVEDEFGQSATAVSNPIAIKVDEQEERKELFLINFNFGKSMATSEYLEARVENLAKNLLDRVKYLGPNARIEATVVGHTDIVGTSDANEALSWERSEKEYHNLLNGIMVILELDNEDEVVKWLRDHRVTVRYAGRAWREPMVVSRFEEGYWQKELIGNNTYSEGRLVNRRVVLEIITITE